MATVNAAHDRQPPFTAVTLDFWHLAEHGYAARREVFANRPSMA